MLVFKVINVTCAMRAEYNAGPGPARLEWNLLGNQLEDVVANNLNAMRNESRGRGIARVTRHTGLWQTTNLVHHLSTNKRARS